MRKLPMIVSAIGILAATPLSAQTENYTFQGCGDFLCVKEEVTVTPLAFPFTQGQTFTRTMTWTTTFTWLGKGGYVGEFGTYDWRLPDPIQNDLYDITGWNSVQILNCWVGAPCTGTSFDIKKNNPLPIGYDVSTSQFGIWAYDARNATFEQLNGVDFVRSDGQKGAKVYIPVYLTPEPSTLALFAIFVAPIGIILRRRSSLGKHAVT